MIETSLTQVSFQNETLESIWGHQTLWGGGRGGWGVQVLITWTILDLY